MPLTAMTAGSAASAPPPPIGRGPRPRPVIVRGPRHPAHEATRVDRDCLGGIVVGATVAPPDPGQHDAQPVGHVDVRGAAPPWIPLHEHQVRTVLVLTTGQGCLRYAVRRRDVRHAPRNVGWRDDDRLGRIELGHDLYSFQSAPGPGLRRRGLAYPAKA